MSKILIVEDDENILELEKDYIEASNMEVQQTETTVLSLRLITITI